MIPVTYASAAALQKQLWALTEQHGRKVEELEAEIKQKGVQLGQLQATKAAAEAKGERKSERR